MSCRNSGQNKCEPNLRAERKGLALNKITGPSVSVEPEGPLHGYILNGQSNGQLNTCQGETLHTTSVLKVIIHF